MRLVDPTITNIFNEDCRDFIPRLPDECIDAMITDPPYGANFWSRRARTAEGKKLVSPIANDESLAGALGLFAEVLDLVKPKLKPDADLYVFTKWDIVGEWVQLIRSFDWLAYKMLLVWDKGIPGMGDIDSNWGCGHELVLYCKQAESRRPVSYRRSAILAIDKVHPTAAIHPTEKPVPLLEYFVDMSTKPGQVVFDPFSGSGSTTVAAQNMGRVGIGVEQDTENGYYERSLRRLEQKGLFA